MTATAVCRTRHHCDVYHASCHSKAHTCWQMRVATVWMTPYCLLAAHPLQGQLVSTAAAQAATLSNASQRQQQPYQEEQRCVEGTARAIA